MDMMSLFSSMMQNGGSKQGLLEDLLLHNGSNSKGFSMENLLPMLLSNMGGNGENNGEKGNGMEMLIPLLSNMFAKNTTPPQKKEEMTNLPLSPICNIANENITYALNRFISI